MITGSNNDIFEIINLFHVNFITLEVIFKASIETRICNWIRFNSRMNRHGNRRNVGSRKSESLLFIRTYYVEAAMALLQISSQKEMYLRLVPSNGLRVVMTANKINKFLITNFVNKNAKNYTTFLSLNNRA